MAAQSDRSELAKHWAGNLKIKLERVDYGRDI
jgi:hypothetical protein